MATTVTTISAVPSVPGGSDSGPAVPVQPVAAPAPVSDGSTGESLPASGQSVPVGATAAQLGAAVDEINVFLRATARQFVFQLDSSTGKSQVTVVNPQTGEIIRQIPDLHALQLAQTIADTGMPLTGMLMDTQA